MLGLNTRTENIGELLNVPISRTRGVFSFRTWLHQWMKPSCALLGFLFVWSCQSKLQFAGLALMQGRWGHGEEHISIHRLSHVLLQNNNWINASKAAPLSLGRAQAGDVIGHRFTRQAGVLHVCYTVTEHPSPHHRRDVGHRPQPDLVQGTALYRLKCFKSSLPQGRMKRVLWFSPEWMTPWPSLDKPLETEEKCYIVLFKCLDPFCTFKV